MTDIYREILTALRTEKRVMLATILSTSGSTPAGALSKMLVKQEGIVAVGTVGGGCMEGEVLLHANRLWDAGRAEVLTFHLNDDDLENGLICGGSLDVLIEPVTQAQAGFVANLKSLRDTGNDSVIATLLGEGGVVRMKELVGSAEPSALEPLSARVGRPAEELSELFHRAFRRQETQRLAVSGGELLFEPVAGAPGLIIFGGGHVAKYVSRIASLAGFRVVVADDREKYANAVRFPEAAATVVADFSEAVRRVEVKPSSYLLIVTRGHEHDETVLRQALGTPASYIGMIGSRRKVLKAFEHLLSEGVPAEQLRRVRAPVGLDIRAVTAEEIAVSIVAQLINVRRHGARLVPEMSNDTEADLSALLNKSLIASGHA